MANVQIEFSKEGTTITARATSMAIVAADHSNRLILFKGKIGDTFTHAINTPTTVEVRVVAFGEKAMFAQVTLDPNGSGKYLCRIVPDETAKRSGLASLFGNKRVQYKIVVQEV